MRSQWSSNGKRAEVGPKASEPARKRGWGLGENQFGRMQTREWVLLPEERGRTRTKITHADAAH